MITKKSFLMIGSVVLAAVTVIGIAVFLIIGKESPKKTFEEYAALQSMKKCIHI